MTQRRSLPSDRPAKPYPGFPLFPHATGRWAKSPRPFELDADLPSFAPALLE
jgi:hypothetical protein